MRRKTRGSVSTPDFTVSSASSTQAHSTPSSRLEANDGGQDRPQTTPQFTPRSDPGLAAVVDAWPRLPEALRAGILAMVTSTSKCNN
jgi:hypothetical protein